MPTLPEMKDRRRHQDWPAVEITVSTCHLLAPLCHGAGLGSPLVRLSLAVCLPTALGRTAVHWRILQARHPKCKRKVKRPISVCRVCRVYPSPTPLRAFSVPQFRGGGAWPDLGGRQGATCLPKGKKAGEPNSKESKLLWGEALTLCGD